MGKLMETSQERKKLPLGTNINSWNAAFYLIEREKEQNNQYECLINDGEI
jgi:hypothetical protein